MYPDWWLLFPAAALSGAALSFLPRKADERVEDIPFRSELYSRERLIEHAQQIATTQQVVPGRQRGQPLLPRLDKSARVLLATYQGFASAVRNQEAIIPAAEWLLDNFHIVEEQLADIRKHLPRAYYTELPK